MEAAGDAATWVAAAVAAVSAGVAIWQAREARKARIALERPDFSTHPTNDDEGVVLRLHGPRDLDEVRVEVREGDGEVVPAVLGGFEMNTERVVQVASKTSGGRLAVVLHCRAGRDRWPVPMSWDLPYDVLDSLW